MTRSEFARLRAWAQTQKKPVMGYTRQYPGDGRFPPYLWPDTGTPLRITETGFEAMMSHRDNVTGTTQKTRHRIHHKYVQTTRIYGFNY